MEGDRPFHIIMSPLGYKKHDKLMWWLTVWGVVDFDASNAIGKKLLEKKRDIECSHPAIGQASGCNFERSEM
jgi:hypothetical protein